MKNGKRPNRQQKIYLYRLGFEANDWLISKNTSLEFMIIHRYTNQIRIITKGLII